MQKDNYIILTGAMGAGKSTILTKLKQRGYTCVDEPARIVIAEQRAIGGSGLPEADARLFTQLMLGKMKQAYHKHLNSKDIVFFDRGLPDLAGYADLFNIDSTPFISAANEYRFNKHVFMFNGWKGIYTTDDERKMSLEDANRFGVDVRKIYEDCGYILHDVPFVSVDERVEFIIKKVNTIA